MSDDIQAPATDSPDTSAPNTGLAQTDEQVNWEQRFKETQSWGHQQAQEAAQYRDLVESLTDPDTQAEALARLGLELEAEEVEEPDYVDPNDQLAAELAEVKAYIQQQQEQAQAQQHQEQVVDYVNSQIAELEKNTGEEFSEEEIAFLVSRAERAPDARGLPDVTAAWNALNGVYEQRQQKWIESKKAPKLPAGQSAKQAFDTSTEQGRRAYAEHLMGAGEQAA